MSRRGRVSLREGVILRLLAEAERQGIPDSELAARAGLLARQVRRLWRGEAGWAVADAVSSVLGISWDFSAPNNT